jgi:hypothetical protein
MPFEVSTTDKKYTAAIKTIFLEAKEFIEVKLSTKNQVVTGLFDINSDHPFLNFSSKGGVGQVQCWLKYLHLYIF